jgi:hypothetical protein
VVKRSYNSVVIIKSYIKLVIYITYYTYVSSETLTANRPPLTLLSKCVIGTDVALASEPL